MVKRSQHWHRLLLSSLNAWARREAVKKLSNPPRPVLIIPGLCGWRGLLKSRVDALKKCFCSRMIPPLTHIRMQEKTHVFINFCFIFFLLLESLYNCPSNVKSRELFLTEGNKREWAETDGAGRVLHSSNAPHRFSSSVITECEGGSAEKTKVKFSSFQLVWACRAIVNNSHWEQEVHKGLEWYRRERSLLGMWEETEYSTFSGLLRLFLCWRIVFRLTTKLNEEKEKGDAVLWQRRMLWRDASSTCGQVSHTEVRLGKGQAVVFEQRASPESQSVCVCL